MSPPTGRSGSSQPGRRRRRRGRRGAGAEAGKDHGATPSNQANPTESSGTRSGAPSANAASKPAGRSRRRSGKGGAKSRANTAAKANTGAKSNGKATGKSAGKVGGKVGDPTFTKPGGRRLRTVDETSAGGLVVDPNRASAALIGRLDRRGRLLWSLPKGHIESGETPEQAAVREVAEETGIAGRVLAPLGTIDYWFVAEDRRVHKTVHHFLMEAVGGELSDEDVEVTEVAWVPLGELDGRLAYADERRLVRLATELLSESA